MAHTPCTNPMHVCAYVPWLLQANACTCRAVPRRAMGAGFETVHSCLALMNLSTILKFTQERVIVSVGGAWLCTGARDEGEGRAGDCCRRHPRVGASSGVLLELDRVQGGGGDSYMWVQLYWGCAGGGCGWPVHGVGHEGVCSHLLEQHVGPLGWGPVSPAASHLGSRAPRCVLACMVVGACVEVAEQFRRGWLLLLPTSPPHTPPSAPSLSRPVCVRPCAQVGTDLILMSTDGGMNGMAAGTLGSMAQVGGREGTNQWLHFMLLGATGIYHVM